MWTFLVWSNSGQVSRPVSGVSGHAAAVNSPAEGALEGVGGLSLGRL